MGIDDELVQEILRRILTVTRPDMVILFGSAATGGMTPDSDIDLLIVGEMPCGQREASQLIRRALQGLAHPFDIIVMASERFRETRDVVGGVAYPASKYGKVIYEAA